MKSLMLEWACYEICPINGIRALRQSSDLLKPSTYSHEQLMNHQWLVPTLLTVSLATFPSSFFPQYPVKVSHVNLKGSLQPKLLTLCALATSFRG